MQPGADGGVFGFEYDARGRRTALTRPNGITTQASFDPASQLQSLVHQLAGAPDPLARFEYSYNGVGNRVGLAQSRAVPPVKASLAYAYDAKDQLISATRALLGAPPESFTYDALGNRIARDGEPFASVFNAANQLLEDDNACYAYDANGNRVRAQAKVSGACTGTVTEYVYDPENRLIEVIEAGATIARYRYDALGRRIEKVTAAGTRRYVYDREDIFLEYDATDTLRARYTHGPGVDEPLAMERDIDGDGAFETLSYHSDALGSVTELTDAAGAVVQAYVYDAFGETTITDGTGTTLEAVAAIATLMLEGGADIRYIQAMHGSCGSGDD